MRPFEGIRFIPRESFGAALHGIEAALGERNASLLGVAAGQGSPACQAAALRSLRRGRKSSSGTGRLT